VLTDAELVAYLGYVHPQEHWRAAILERQVMACIARVFAGLRTADLHSMRWDALDSADGAFTWGWAPRQKTRRPQLLEVPEMLRPMLRDWWERHGRPTSGLVFPARRGRRAGEVKNGR
jgi:integrase